MSLSGGARAGRLAGSHPSPLPRGYRIGDWEVAELIGSGGWATVYAGRPVGDGTGGSAAVAGDVALKFMPTAGLSPRQAANVVDIARREVELGRRARHPRLIRLLDSVVLSEPDDPCLDGAIVLVMERARRSLRDLLRAGAAEEGGAAGPAEAESERLCTEICEGLAHLHRSGWVHGDLKPDNVLLMADGSVRLSDFGLATELTGTRGTHGYAPPMGTFDYLPPERWKAPLGEHGVQVRPSADIWALGVVIHEVFASGTSPFPGATPMARGAAVQEYAQGRAPLRMADSVPGFWRGLAADCLAPTHAARSAHTADSLLARIAARRTGEPVPTGQVASASTGTRDEIASRRRRRSERSAVAAVTAVVACVIAATLLPFTADDGAFSTSRAGGALGTSGASVTHGTGPVSGAKGQVRVFNAERPCQADTRRRYECSLGLAIDPLQPYTADNVALTRVWHGDVIDAECRLARGMPIIDEAGSRSTAWYRVRLPDDPVRSTAWLPAVRTKDRPSLQPCPDSLTSPDALAP
ncbi:serine/threonine-protein kinase [Streptomyces sp. KLOTTS4A1]|uniref:serine/threonine-protein kinase n=1 Tax=Streptomyces sp. KLOTTS4A1 TaxID=3390996 RepID=UPI0039F522FB